MSTIAKDLPKFGLTIEDLTRKVVFLNDLKKYPLNIVNTECVKTMNYTVGNSKEMTFINGNKYIMSISMYNELHELKNGPKVLKPSSKNFMSSYRHYDGNDLTNKSLLVWRTGGIGDLLFIQPSLIFLKNKYPSCKITFACNPENQSMVKEWDCIDSVVSLPFDFRLMIQHDYHIVFEGVIERCREAEVENALCLFSRWMGLDIPKEELVPSQKVNISTLQYCEEYLSKQSIDEFILIQPRASSVIRTPNPDVWVQVVNYLTEKNHKVILIDSPKNHNKIDEIIKKCDNQSSIFNFTKDSKSLSCMISMTYLSKLCISVDSSLIHITASLNKPGIGIYGPFPGSIRLSTYPTVEWVDCISDCSPCFKHNHNPCELSKDGYCISFNNLPFENLIQKIEKTLNKQ